MLFQSTVPQVFKQMVVNASSSANAERKKETAKRLNFYHDAQLSYLEEILTERHSEPDRIFKVELNLVRKVINNLAQIYCEPPAREIDGSDIDRKIYKQMVNSSIIDLRLKQASRYVKLLKSILIRPTWRNGHLDLDILTGNLLDVECGDTPEELRKVLITDYGNSEKIEDVQYSLWTTDSWRRLDYRGNVIDAQENPYEILPFLPVFDYPPINNNFWLPGGEDLINQQELINLKLTDLSHLIFWQSFGVGYIKSDSDEHGDPLTIGPGTLVELTGDGELGFVSQKAEIHAVVSAIDKMIKWFCITQGLSAGAVSTDPSVASGVSKVWDSRELSEMRIEDKLLWSAYEQKLFDLMRTIHNFHSKDKISESARLKVNFADPPKPTISPLDEAQSWETLQKLGVVSPVDILMQRDKDLRSREEALERLKLIQSETKQLIPSGQDVKQGEYR